MVLSKDADSGDVDDMRLLCDICRLGQCLQDVARDEG